LIFFYSYTVLKSRKLFSTRTKRYTTDKGGIFCSSPFYGRLLFCSFKISNKTMLNTSTSF